MPTGHYLAALRDTAKAEDVIMAYHEGESYKQAGALSQRLKVNFTEELKGHGWDVKRHHLQVDEWRWSTQQSDKTE